MSIESILSQVDAEIARLTQVKNLLMGSPASSPAGRGRKAKSAPAKTATKRARVLSPEARKRIADAQKRRWAAQRSKAKKEA